MTCPKCGNQMQIQAVSEVKRRGFFTVLLYLFLILIPVIGWIILINLMRGQKSQTKMLAVCQTCGYKCEYKEHETYSNGATGAGRMGAYSADGMSLSAFVTSMAIAFAFSIFGIVVMLKWSWWGLALVGVGVGILAIVYNKV